METLQTITDKLSISLSLLCAIHCLALPVILTLLPSLAALQLDNEAFHYWMVLAVIPTSIYALTMGCKRHKHFRLLLIGGAGLALLVLAVVLGEEAIGESGEKILTLLGATLVAIGHFWNFRLCRQQDCACPDSH
ncbi:MAG: MerC domain-containing protein [Gammaproteobacteria bacterium]|nr:MerC domain-containing protein [Gammaproteobacteria bacterium]